MVFTYVLHEARGRRPPYREGAAGGTAGSERGSECRGRSQEQRRITSGFVYVSGRQLLQEQIKRMTYEAHFRVGLNSQPQFCQTELRGLK